MYVCFIFTTPEEQTLILYKCKPMQMCQRASKAARRFPVHSSKPKPHALKMLLNLGDLFALRRSSDTQLTGCIALQPTRNSSLMPCNLEFVSAIRHDNLHQQIMQSYAALYTHSFPPAKVLAHHHAKIPSKVLVAFFYFSRPVCVSLRALRKLENNADASLKACVQDDITSNGRLPCRKCDPGSKFRFPNRGCC